MDERTPCCALYVNSRAKWVTKCENERQCAMIMRINRRQEVVRERVLWASVCRWKCRRMCKRVQKGARGVKGNGRTDRVEW